jgi:histone deacetylase complex regulatory component SIN3
MLPEYDFRDGVRGKHARALQQGYTVRVHRPDGTTAVQRFSLPQGTVVLEPDVQEYFPDSESVNHALRTLIELIPSKRQTRRRKP